MTRSHSGGNHFCLSEPGRGQISHESGLHFARYPAWQMAIIGPTIDLADRDRVLGRRYTRPQEVDCGGPEMARNGRPDKSAEMVGAAAGGAVCGAIGALVGGPVGAAAGAAVGGWLGHKVAEEAKKRGL